MIRACIYARVSSEEQATPDKASIPAQLDACRKLADSLGWLIAGEYVDDRKYRIGKRLVEPSGERVDRPQWLRMLEELREGRADAVVAFHSSRLYRNYRPALDFLELVETHNIQVKLSAESFDPRVAMLFAWRDREESKTRVSRSTFGKMGAVKNGFIATSHTPFYRTLRDATGRRIGCELVEAYRPFLDRMAALFLAHVSYQKMAEALGTNPISGVTLAPQSVRMLMRNRFFLGQVSYGHFALTRGTPKFTGPGVQPAAWDADTCAAIERELARRDGVGKSVAHPRTGGVGLFWGLLRCGYCGHVLSAHRAHDYISYYCYSALTGKFDHPRNSISQRQVIKLLAEFAQAIDTMDLEQWLPLFAAPERAAPDPAPRQAIVDALAETLAELEALPATSRRAKLALSVEVERLQNQLALLEAERAIQAAPAPDPEQVRAAWGELARNLPTMTRAQIAGIIPALYIKDRALAVPVPVL